MTSKQRPVFSNPASSGQQVQSDPPQRVFIRPREPIDHVGYSNVDAPSPKSTSVCATIKLIFRYIWADVLQRPRNYCIGMMAVICLVFFSGAVLLSTWKIPYILLRLGELNVGEIDMGIQENDPDNPLLNFTEIRSRFHGIPEVRGVAPRWLTRASVFRSDVSDTCLQSFGVSTRVNLLLLDTELERTIGIGRMWGHPDTGRAEAHVLQSVLDFLRLRPNRDERMNINLLPDDVSRLLQWDMMKQVLNMSAPKNGTGMSSFLSAVILQELKNKLADDVAPQDAHLSVKVLDGFESPDGKYPVSLGNVVIMDYKHFFSAFTQEGCVFFSPGRGLPISWLNSVSGGLDKTKDTPPLESVPIVLVVFRDRRDMYYMSEEMRSREMVKRTNAIMRNTLELDFNGTIFFPLDESIQKFKMFKAILISSFGFVVFGIVVLCIILFAALLQTNAEERQFEFAMMRALGMRKTQIVALLTMQSLGFILPALLLCAPLFLGVNAVIEHFISVFTKAVPRMLSVPPAPVIFALLMGLFLPLGMSFVLARRALNSSLRDALDVHRQVQSEVKVVMVKLEKLGLSLRQLLLGVFLVIAGFVAYYLIPLTFFFENLTLFFSLLNFVVVVMLTGLCIIMYVFEPCMESFFLWLMVFGREKRFLMIIKKNLLDHRVRNSKTYMMLLLSVASLVFSGLMFVTLSSTSAQMLSIANGADVVVTSTSFGVSLDEELLSAFLEKQRGAVVVDYAYHSFSLGNYPQIASATYLKTILGAGSYTPVVAVSKSFLNTVFPEYILENSRDMRYPYNRTVDGRNDVVGSMYDHPHAPFREVDRVVATGLSTLELARTISKKPAHSVPAVVASTLQDGLGVEAGSTMVLDYKYELADVVVKSKFQVVLRGIMDRLSGFPEISSLPFRSGKSPMLVSQPLFRTLLSPWTIDFSGRDNITLAPHTLTDIRQRRLFVRLRRGISAAERAAFVNEIRALTDVTYHRVVDTYATVNRFEDVREFIMYFFYFTAFVCIFLCTLMLWITFIANVRLNSQTIGLLRALGCTKWQIVRITLYEAFSIVFSAFFLGLIVGCVVGITLGVQLSSLMVLPFRFIVPYGLVGLIFALSVVAAAVGSMLPLRSINNAQIGLVTHSV